MVIFTRKALTQPERDRDLEKEIVISEKEIVISRKEMTIFEKEIAISRER